MLGSSLSSYKVKWEELGGEKVVHGRETHLKQEQRREAMGWVGVGSRVDLILA